MELRYVLKLDFPGFPAVKNEDKEGMKGDF